MRTIFQGLARVVAWLDNLELALVAGLALLAVVLGPLVVAGAAAWSGHWVRAAGLGIPWLLLLGRAGWEMASGRLGSATAGLGFLWLGVTLFIGGSLL